MVLIECDPEMKQCERNTVKRMQSEMGAFVFMLPHHQMRHPTIPPGPTLLTLEPRCASAHSPTCLGEKGSGRSRARFPKTIFHGSFPHRNVDQWLHQAHTSPMGLDSKKILCSRGFSIVWLSTVGFREQRKPVWEVFAEVRGRGGQGHTRAIKWKVIAFLKICQPLPFLIFL